MRTVRADASLPAQPAVIETTPAALAGDSREWDVFDKLDGHRLLLRVGAAYRRSRVRNEWSALPPHIQALALDEWLDGELYLPGEPATAVATALSGLHAGRLRFGPFHCPGRALDPRAEHSLLRSLGLAPPQYIGRYTGDEIAARWDEWSRQLVPCLSGEGLVLKLMATEPVWHKLKRVSTIDLPVVAMSAGRGRLAGSVGALLCRLPGGALVRVGSGLDDRQRRHLSRRDLGRICEVAYLRRTERGSLQHPRFLRWRDDLPQEAGIFPNFGNST